VFQLPQTGVATYVGDIVGVANGRSAVGPYRNVWNFGANSGAVTATFDNAQFQGNTSGSNGGFRTPVPIQSSNFNRSLQLNGNFFGSGDVPAYQFGNFSVSGERGRYSASGIFVGRAGR
jgi:hypothetical protein